MRPGTVRKSKKSRPQQAFGAWGGAQGMATLHRAQHMLIGVRGGVGGLLRGDFYSFLTFVFEDFESSCMGVDFPDLRFPDLLKGGKSNRSRRIWCLEGCPGDGDIITGGYPPFELLY